MKSNLEAALKAIEFFTRTKKDLANIPPEHRTLTSKISIALDDCVNAITADGLDAAQELEDAKRGYFHHDSAYENRMRDALAKPIEDLFEGDYIDNRTYNAMQPKCKTIHEIVLLTSCQLNCIPRLGPTSYSRLQQGIQNYGTAHNIKLRLGMKPEELPKML
jgi:hypothetical protein